MLVPTIAEAFGACGLTKSDIGFWCSGSSDYLAGRAFSFVSAVDAIGAFPPITESHVEMDGAWALYEAWVKILTGEVDTALVYGFGKSSAGVLRRILALQLDPYLVAPLGAGLVRAGRRQRPGRDPVHGHPHGRWLAVARPEDMEFARRVRRPGVRPVPQRPDRRPAPGTDVPDG